MKPLHISAAIFLAFLFLSTGCSVNKVMLFNGKDLTNWTLFSGDEEVDPASIFWVEDGMIHTSGDPYGYIRTKDTYDNFKLHVEWRWMEEPTNSGVLLHVQGKDMIWPLAIECQLMHEHAGDLVLIGKGAGLIVGDQEYLVESEENRYLVIAKQKEISEKSPGEWNSYEITSLDGTMEVVVNGVLQNSARGVTLTGGNILLQSEGSPMQFRNIYLEEL